VIAFVRGTVAQVGLSSVVVDIGGVGLEVNCTPGTIATLREGATAHLPTSMVVREESLTVFGFLDEDEKNVFELLQTASGVGPRLAQAMLAVHRPDDLRRAVASEDLAALTKVPGIGKKGAQRIVLELKDRLGAPAAGAAAAANGAPVTAASDGTAAWRIQVRGALLGLGWSAREAETALDAVEPLAQEQAEAGTAPEVASLLRAALRTLSRA
jgi:holliday junction DNA helicase RuvA